MESFIAHWNTLSESARQIIIGCVPTEVIIWALMINLLMAYDNGGETWTMEDEVEIE